MYSDYVRSFCNGLSVTQVTCHLQEMYRTFLADTTDEVLQYALH